MSVCCRLPQLKNNQKIFSIEIYPFYSSSLYVFLMNEKGSRGVNLFLPAESQFNYWYDVSNNHTLVLTRLKYIY